MKKLVIAALLAGFSAPSMAVQTIEYNLSAIDIATHFSDGVADDRDNEPGVFRFFLGQPPRTFATLTPTISGDVLTIEWLLLDPSAPSYSYVIRGILKFDHDLGGTAPLTADGFVSAGSSFYSKVIFSDGDYVEHSGVFNTLDNVIITDEPEVEGAGDPKFEIGVAVALVPEPTTWAMMIGGFALAGAALRRRTAIAFA